MASSKSARRAPTRERILNASTELFGRHGFTGTGIKSILAASEAPFGSLYHFFPGGKDELGAAAIRRSGVTYRELVEAFFVADADGRVDVVGATSSFFEGAAAMIELTDYADACPIATIALEIASTNESMREASAEAFESWLAVLRAAFCSVGIDAERSAELAVELFCAIEGAFLLSRTTRDPAPVRIAGRAAAESVRAALEAVPGG
ncbi:MAG: TetR family transcriptional regulator [Ilumatobacteraceae bacterium]|nr:TetR family transcriptional regulator [Ilumatobacteraceae bacterium]